LPLKEIVRLATEDDLLQYEKNEYDADEAMALCKETIQQHELEMRLVNCEYTLDKSKVIFNFTSDERVDFRKLVKVLAQKLKTRIELR
ncbi:PSP1 domain-containing protein, partial [Staphylococcus aureus]|nr:PSP1 domain-containing protein [Staphylococcus aureus]